MQQWVNDRLFEVTAVYTEFYNPAQPLPPHALVVNAIGEADLCAVALARAEQMLAPGNALMINPPMINPPVINPPALVRATGRANNARRLAGIPGVIAPATA